MKSTQHQQRDGTRLSINLPGKQDSIGLHSLRISGVPTVPPQSSPDTKDCCLLEQGFLGFIIRQMCRHGNPSQALNLSLCRGILSLLTAAFPPSTFLLELEERGSVLETKKKKGDTFLSEILGNVFMVLIPNLMRYRHPAGQTGASL